MKSKCVFLFLIQISVYCFAAETEVDPCDQLNETPTAEPYQYEARWMHQEYHTNFQNIAREMVQKGLDSKYLQLLDSDMFFFMCGGWQKPSFARRGEIITHYGTVLVKIYQFFVYIDKMLQCKKGIPDPDIFSMIMRVVPNKILTRASLLSLFHLAGFLEKRASKIGDFGEFLTFYQQMLCTTKEANWTQLMIELAKTRQEFLNQGLIDRYLKVRDEEKSLNVRKVMHKVRMELEVELGAASTERRFEEELVQLSEIQLYD